MSVSALAFGKKKKKNKLSSFEREIESLLWRNKS